MKGNMKNRRVIVVKLMYGVKYIKYIGEQINRKVRQMTS